MDSNSQTLQRYLKSLSPSSNYQTAVIGKWHLAGGSPDVNHPTDSGVDYYAGTIAGVIDSSVYSNTHSKGSLYEGGLRVPMIVSGKGVTREDVHESALINTSDFYASIINFTGNEISQLNDSYSFVDLFSVDGDGQRTYNYAEFQSNDVTGWAVRSKDYKLIEFDDGTQELYLVSEDLAETTNIISNNSDIVGELAAYAQLIRGESNGSAIDITNVTLSSRNANCADYVERYQSTVLDVNNSQIFNGDLTISLVNGKCIFQTNNIPNHDFNDGGTAFPNDVSAQNITFEITATPSHALTSSNISLQFDNAILLNGVKVDLLAAACYGVGDGKIGCNDINQPWRYDPMFVANGFKVDSHNAHSQPNGSYHYHGKPNVFYDEDNTGVESPLVGFAADGYPIYGPYFNDGSSVRKALSSYQVTSGNRPDSTGNPGGVYDGTYRDDYQYIDNHGDLDECNGMTVNGVYGYYITDGFPYILTCFKGGPDSSFNK